MFPTEAGPKPAPEAQNRPLKPGPGTGRTIEQPTLCYAVMLPGWKSDFRGGFEPHSNQENTEIGPPARLRPAGGPMLRLSRLESGRNPARRTDFRLGKPISGPGTLFN